MAPSVDFSLLGAPPVPRHHAQRYTGDLLESPWSPAGETVTPDRGVRRGGGVCQDDGDDLDKRYLPVMKVGRFSEADR